MSDVVYPRKDSRLQEVQNDEEDRRVSLKQRLFENMNRNLEESEYGQFEQNQGNNVVEYQRNRFGEFDIIEKETEPLPKEVYYNGENVVEVQLGDQDYDYEGEEEQYFDSNREEIQNYEDYDDDYELNSHHMVSGMSGYSDKSRLAKFFNKKKKSGEKKDGGDISALK